MTKKALILAIFLSLPLISFASIDINLKYGSTGSAVTELQEFLVSKGFLNTQPTGNFYSLTLAAVKAYQTSANVPSTGFVGPLTRAAINTDLATSIQESDTQEQQETGTVAPITQNPVQTPVTPPLGNSVPNPIPIVVSLGDLKCDLYSNTLPIIVDGSWSKMDVSFGSFQVRSLHNSVQGVLIDRPFTKSVTFVNGKDHPTLDLYNVPSTIPISISVYDVSGNQIGTLSQNYTVDNTCATSLSLKDQPVIHDN